MIGQKNKFLKIWQRYETGDIVVYSFVALMFLWCGFLVASAILTALSHL